MKKILLILVLMLAAVSPIEAARPSVNRSGDTTTIVADGDTLKITDQGVANAIEQAVNDTIWEENGYNEDEENATTAREIAGRWAEVATIATGIVCVSIVVIVFLCLLFYFLHRRAKYRTIEKAIENNYPLPPSLGGSQPYKAAPQQPDAWRGAAPQMPPQAPQANPQATMPNAPQQQVPYNTNVPQQAPMFYRTNYQAYKGSIKLICVGLALSLFFAATGATPLAWMMMMLTFLGLGKALITYKEQQQDRAYWQWQMQQQAQMPKQPQPEAPKTEEQPPVFTQPTDQQ